MTDDGTIEPQQLLPGRELPLPVQLDPSKATPVYGTAQPAGGAPAQLRRAAYSRPAHDPVRWMTLLAADRAEAGTNIASEIAIPGRQPLVIRHYFRQMRAHPTGYVVGAVGALGVWLGLRRRSRRG